MSVDSDAALRTTGNSTVIVSLILNLLPVLILLITIVSLYYVVKSLKYAKEKPIRAAIVPLLVLLARFLMMTKVPLYLEPVINSSYPVQNHYLETGRSVRVADLHCDAMLWTSGARPLLSTVFNPINGRPIGSVDVPRLKRGNVNIQVFAAVTSSPRRMNFESNERPKTSDDMISILALLEWPMSTYFSTLQRALHQASQLYHHAGNSNGELVVVLNGDQLMSVMDNPIHRVAGILAVEGLHVLDQRISNVDVLHAAGYRILGPTHFFDTEVGGSSTGAVKGGLSQFGMDVVHRMKQLGMIIDVAHSSEQLIRDLLALNDDSVPPLILSHTGVFEVCASNRNYPIQLIGKLIERGALIGVTLFKPALCGDNLVMSFVQTVLYIVDHFGVDHVCLGSDWDGGTHTALDAGDVQVLAEALRSIGKMSDADAEKVMFGNARNFFVKSL